MRGDLVTIEPRPLLKPTEVAAHLSVSVASVRRYVHVGLLDAVWLTSQTIRVFPASVDWFLLVRGVCSPECGEGEPADVILAAIKRAVDRRALAEGVAGSAAADIDRLVPMAKEAGIGVEEVAQALGVAPHMAMGRYREWSIDE